MIRKKNKEDEDIFDKVLDHFNYKDDVNEELLPIDECNFLRPPYITSHLKFALIFFLIFYVFSLFFILTRIFLIYTFSMVNHHLVVLV